MERNTSAIMEENGLQVNAQEEHYIHIGYLLYSVAASDGRVTVSEAERLKGTIKRSWLGLDGSRDEVGTDDAYYIEFSFDLARDQHMDPEEAFARFKEYFSGAPERFVPSERELILGTARAIAGANHGHNKSELVQLARIDAMLHGTLHT
jgi:hypothetical protein